jgi:hypothetical protein
MKRICQKCGNDYNGTTNERYCGFECRVEAKKFRAKVKYQWNRTQKTLSLEERRRELDEILGPDE